MSIQSINSCTVVPALWSGWAGPGHRDEKDGIGFVPRRGQDPLVYQGTGKVNVGVLKGYLCEEMTSEPEKKMLETGGEIEAGEGEGENILGPGATSSPRPGQRQFKTQKDSLADVSRQWEMQAPENTFPFHGSGEVSGICRTFIKLAS